MFFISFFFFNTEATNERRSFSFLAAKSGLDFFHQFPYEKAVKTEMKREKTWKHQPRVKRESRSTVSQNCNATRYISVHERARRPVASRRRGAVRVKNRRRRRRTRLVSRRVLSATLGCRFTNVSGERRPIGCSRDDSSSAGCPIPM